MVYMAFAILMVMAIVVLVVALIYAHGDAKARREMDHEAGLRALEAAHRAAVYGDERVQ